MSLIFHLTATWLSWRSRPQEVGVSDCDVITRRWGSVRYDVTWWFRRFPAAGIPSASYGAVMTSVGVVSAETSGNDAVTMETQHNKHVTQVNGALQALSPAPLTWWTRLVSAAAVDWTRRNRCDAAEPAHDDAMTSLAATVLTRVYMPHYVQIWRHSQNRKYSVHNCNAAREGPSHGYR